MAPGTDGIAHHVNECGAHIEIALLAAIQCQHNAAVDHQRQERDPEHQLVIHGLGMNQTCDGFPENVKGDDDQRNGIDESGNHTRALVPECLHLISGSALEIKPDSRKQQSHRVCEVVPGVREQR